MWIFAGGCALYGLYSTTNPLQAIKYATSVIIWVIVCMDLTRGESYGKLCSKFDF